MLALGASGTDFGILKHLETLNAAGVSLTASPIEASVAILALLPAAVALGERTERGSRGRTPLPAIGLTARGGEADSVAPAVTFNALEVASTSLARGGWTVCAPIVA